MKIVAISRILDEADIVEAFIRHTASFAQHHIILDNGSTDGTIDILRSLAHEGFNLTVYQNQAISFSEQAFMTFMYGKAVNDHGADWVACLDGDEFIDDRHLEGGLGTFLLGIKSNVTCLKLPWTHYHYSRSDSINERIVPKRIVHRTEITSDYKVIVHSSLIASGVVIADGGHDILINGSSPENTPIVEGVCLAHYSERSPFQTIVKFTRGWVKAIAAGREVVERGVSYHYKGPFEAIRDRPADLLRSEWFMTRKNESSDLTIDPINYMGGPLRYTPDLDPGMLAVRSLAGYMELLGKRHADLIDAIPEARAFVEKRNREHTQLI